MCWRAYENAPSRDLLSTDGTLQNGSCIRLQCSVKSAANTAHPSLHIASRLCSQTKFTRILVGMSQVATYTSQPVPRVLCDTLRQYDDTLSRLYSNDHRLCSYRRGSIFLFQKFLINYSAFLYCVLAWESLSAALPSTDTHLDNTRWIGGLDIVRKSIPSLFGIRSTSRVSNECFCHPFPRFGQMVRRRFSKTYTCTNYIWPWHWSRGKRGTSITTSPKSSLGAKWSRSWEQGWCYCKGEYHLHCRVRTVRESRIGGQIFKGNDSLSWKGMFVNQARTRRTPVVMQSTREAHGKKTFRTACAWSKRVIHNLDPTAQVIGDSWSQRYPGLFEPYLKSAEDIGHISLHWFPFDGKIEFDQYITMLYQVLKRLDVGHIRKLCLRKPRVAPWKETVLSPACHRKGNICK